MALVSLDINHLARVEGHGDLFVEIQKGKEPCVEMRVTEGTRLFAPACADMG